MQFQVQAKGQEGRHAVSSASRGSREENVRGAKLTEKRTRDAKCSFKCKQGLQGRKLQGCQTDGEKDERGHAVSSASRGSREENVRGAKLTEKRKTNHLIICQTYFPFGLEIRNVVFLNSIIMMLVSFTLLLYFTTPGQCHP